MSQSFTLTLVKSDKERTTREVIGIYNFSNSHPIGIISEKHHIQALNPNKIPNALRFSCISHLIALLLFKITNVLGI